MSRKNVTLIAIAIVVLVLVVFIAGRPKTGEAPAPPDDSGTGDPGFTPPLDVGSKTPGEAAAKADPEEVGPTPTVPKAGHRLLGILGEFDPTLPGAAEIEVRAISVMGGIPPSPVAGSANADGRIDLDVSGLFTRDFEPVELEVLVDHPAYLPARQRVRVEEESVHRVEIPLYRAALLCGRVLDAAGTPARGATVSVHEVTSDAVAEFPTDATTAAKDGSYRLRAVPDRESHLLMAWGSELAPDARLVAASEGTESPVDDLVLPRGSAISGRVLAFGRPVPGAVVELGPRPRVGRLTVNRTTLVRDGDRVRKGAFRVVTGEDGSFRFAGLAAVDHEVTVDDVPGVRMHSGFSSSLQREVRAPANGVDFDVTGARVVLLVQSEGEPLDRYGLTIQGGGGMMAISVRGEERATLILTPGESHKLHVHRAGYLGNQVTVEAPAHGGSIDLTIPLTKKPPSPTLVVTFRVEPGAPPVTRAGFGLYPRDTERDMMPGFCWESVSADEEGRFRVEELPVGPYVLVVRPGTSWLETQGHFLFAEVEIELPEGGEVAVSLDAKLGGRLRITARDEEGNFLNASCRVLTEDGRPIGVGFVAQSSSRVTYGDEGLVGSVPNEVNPPLAPGKYRIELEMEGRHPRSVSADLLRGRTTDLNVVLEKR